MVQNKAILKIQEGSFRDPSGFLFYEEEKLLRQVNKVYKTDYDFLKSSGLLKTLHTKGLLIPHEELTNHEGLNSSTYKVIKPEELKFISYPYEWSFSQLKDAALATLRIQKLSLKHGMVLKDASAYNVQFHEGKPIFIDTLSFEVYEEGKPWVAYKQFCQHFLASLALMSYTDLRLNQLLKIHLDGIPLDLTSKLLPTKTKWNFSLLMHIHLHSNAQKQYENKGSASKEVKITTNKLFALIESLISTVKKLKLKNQETEWGDYYNFTNYTDKSFLRKKEIISDFIDKITPNTLWDLGANTGEFTRIASQKGIFCVACDIDPLAVNSNYLAIRKNDIPNIVPLVTDLTNPSPAIGWNNTERMGFKNRPLPDCIMALALIHHLAISNNLPFSKIATFFSELADNLIIEFVPKSDSKVKILLASRKDIFPDYNEQGFTEAFGYFFNIESSKKIAESERTLYWMTKKNKV